jgi:hypothetical protein
MLGGQNWLNFISGVSGLTILFIFEVLKELWMHLVLPWYLKNYGYPRILNVIGVKNKVNA